MNHKKIEIAPHNLRNSTNNLITEECSKATPLRNEHLTQKGEIGGLRPLQRHMDADRIGRKKSTGTDETGERFHPNNQQIFLPYQKDWVADNASVKICVKSRRIGLTWAEACDNVLTASSASGMDIWYIGYNRDMTKEYIETCSEWAKTFNTVVSEIEDENIVDEDKNILSFRITFESGFKITALSSRPSNLRGKQGKVIIDEAAFHDDLKGLMQSALAFTIWGGKVAIISTHFGDENYFNELINDVLAGRKPYSLHKITFDDAINAGLYERIASTSKAKGQFPQRKNNWVQSIYNLYAEGADEELRCIPSKSGGAYLISSMLEACMVDNIPIIRFTPPADDFVDWSTIRYESYKNAWLFSEIEPFLQTLPHQRRYFAGADFGRSGDITSFWLFVESQNLTLTTLFVVELRNAPYRFQEAVLFHILSLLPLFSGIALDARGIGANISENVRIKYGVQRVIEVSASDKFYSEAFPKLKARFEDKAIIIPRDSDILNDFRQVKVIKGVPKIAERSKDINGNKRHGDTAIACLMGIYAYNELGKIESWSCHSVSTSEYKNLIIGY